jgi:hypothetical protein
MSMYGELVVQVGIASCTSPRQNDCHLIFAKVSIDRTLFLPKLASTSPFN